MKAPISVSVFYILVVLLAAGCAQTRIKKYSDALDPLVGTARKAKVNRMLGSPTKCQHRNDILETCEYRTAYVRNYSVPDFYAKMPGFGPDLSPYEYFDVLSASFDSLGVLQDWQPVVILQE